MADLYHLDEEIDALQENQDLQNEEGEEWETEDAEEIELPEALEEAARRKLQTKDDPAAASDVAVIDDFEEEIFSGKSTKHKEKQLESLKYTHLYQKWAQELLSPELLPYPEELVEDIKSSLEEAEDAIIETGNANMDALFMSIARIDAERAKFLLADFLKLRLHKIQAHPLYMRTQIDRMSQPEAEFLKEYGVAMEQHLTTLVLNHFPQTAWKRLDEESMIDEPNVDEFVFLRTKERIEIGDVVYDSGACLIVRYRRVRDLLLQGKIELI